jgi:hypothetical protein
VSKPIKNVPRHFAENHSGPSSPIAQQALQYESLGAQEGEGCNSARCAVRIKSRRTRLLDPDNLIGGTKYFIDSLRYAGLLHDDREVDITLSVSQEKVSTKKEEGTEIQVTYPKE